MKITKSKLRNLVSEAIQLTLKEGFLGVPSHSPTTDKLVSHLASGIKGAVYDALEQVAADDHVLDLLTRVGEMSPEAEAMNAQVLSAVRQGALDYKNKIHHPLGGVKPASVALEEEADKSALANRAMEAILTHIRKAGEAACSGDQQEASSQRERVESLSQRLIDSGLGCQLAGLGIEGSQPMQEARYSRRPGGTHPLHPDAPSASEAADEVRADKMSREYELLLPQYANEIAEKLVGGSDIPEALGGLDPNGILEKLISQDGLEFIENIKDALPPESPNLEFIEDLYFVAEEQVPLAVMEFLYDSIHGEGEHYGYEQDLRDRGEI